MLFNGVRDSGILAPISGVTATATTAGNLNGTYYYTTVYRLENGTKTSPWPGTGVPVNPANQQVVLTNIVPSANPGVVAIEIYRTTGIPADPKDYRYAGEIANSNITTYTDNVADGSLGAPINWLGTASGYFDSTFGSTLRGISDSQTLAIGQLSNAGYASVSLGAFTGQATTTARRNLFAGVYAGASATSAFENTFLGTHAGNYITTQSSNVFVGTYAGFYAGTGAGASNLNTLIGAGAGQGVNGVGIGQQVVALGYRAAYNINTADQVVAIGPFAGQFANASRQLFVDTGGSARVNLAAQQNEGLMYGEIPNAGNVQTQRINLNGSVRLGSSTSSTGANLPAASAALQGCRRYVTDANVAYSGANLGTTVVGGGANVVPVFCNGTNWVIG